MTIQLEEARHIGQRIGFDRHSPSIVGANVRGLDAPTLHKEFLEVNKSRLGEKVVFESALDVRQHHLQDKRAAQCRVRWLKDGGTHAWYPLYIWRDAPL